MKKGKVIFVIILILVVAVAAVLIYKHFSSANSLSESSMRTTLENCSDLTTQKLVVNDVFKDESGSIPILSHSKYLVKYRAKVNAGFDVKNVDFDINDKSVKVLIPHCTIYEEDVNVVEVVYYDYNFALIKTDKNDTEKSREKAKKRALKFAKSSGSGLLDAADENAVKLIKGMYTDVVGDKELIVEFK